MSAASILVMLFLLAGGVLLLLRTFWGQPAVRPDLLAGGLLCWLIAYFIQVVAG